MPEDKIPQELLEDIYLSESYLVGLFWSNPELYISYSEDKINHDTFGNRIWKLFFYIGRCLRDKGIKKFDDITVEEYLSNKTKIYDEYDEFGGYHTISEIISEVKDKQENFDGYYDEVKKYKMLRELHPLLGDKILSETKKYNYKKLNSEQIGIYWNDKINEKLILCESKIEEHNLLEGLEKFVENADENPRVGLPFNNSKELTNICNGWDYGEIYLWSAFSGKGKTSFTMGKIIVSCIKHNEKLLVIANEGGIDDYKQLLLITIIGNEMYEWLQENKLKGFHRQNFNKGGFTEEDKKKLNYAVKLIKEISNNKHDLIKFVPLDLYTLSNVEKTIRHYANRGYRRVIIDTAKPTDGGGDKQRWVQFIDDFEKLYKLTRPNGGGLNLALWCNVQTADDKVNQRFLDETCLGDAKKIKNVVGVFFASRGVWDDEYAGEKHELKIYSYHANPNSQKGYDIKEFNLERNKDYQYMLVFTPKNRRGQSNDTGLDCLVYKYNLNSNRWIEIGWTKIFKAY